MSTRLRSYVRSLGLDAYVVGGAVRDQLLELPHADEDFLVPGVDQAGLRAALEPHGRVEDMEVHGQLVGVGPTGTETGIERCGAAVVSEARSAAEPASGAATGGVDGVGPDLTGTIVNAIVVLGALTGLLLIELLNFSRIRLGIPHFTIPATQRRSVLVKAVEIVFPVLGVIHMAPTMINLNDAVHERGQGTIGHQAQ